MIWTSTGGAFEFRVQVELSGIPKRCDVAFFEDAMKLATDVLRRAAEENRFTGFSAIEDGSSPRHALAKEASNADKG